ncbi:MAG: single-stranded DNA-binding protein [Pseudonocardiaceae bacterium]
MRNETPVTLVGRVVSDPRSVRLGDDGAMKISFRVAANERRFDKASEKWVDGDSLYLTVNCWRWVAQGVGGSLAKGDPVIVSGRLRTREWTTEQGERRSVTELEASAVGPDLTRCSVTIRRPRRAQDPSDAAVEDSGQPAEPDAEDIEGHDQLSELARAAQPLVPAGV